jgi:hypothetical protein
LVMLLIGATILAGAITGQSWSYALLPIFFLGFYFFAILALRKGLRSATQQFAAFIGLAASKIAAPLSASTASKSGTAFPGVSSAAKSAGPIRSGFSFKDLLPQPKQKVTSASDPFERLAQQRMRQDAGPTGR